MDQLNIIQIDNAHSISDFDFRKSDLMSGYIMDELMEMSPNILYTFNTQDFQERYMAVDYSDADDDPHEQAHNLDACFPFTEDYKEDKSCLYFGNFVQDKILYTFFDLMDLALDHIDLYNTFVLVDRYYIPLNEWYRHLEDLERFFTNTSKLFRGETSEDLFGRIFNGKSLQWLDTFAELNQSANFYPNQEVSKFEDTSCIYISAYRGDTKISLKSRRLSQLIEDHPHQNNFKIFFDNYLSSSSFEDEMVQEFTILKIEKEIGKEFLSHALKPGVFKLMRAVEEKEITHVVIVDKNDLADKLEDQNTILDYLSSCKAKVDIMNV